MSNGNTGLGTGNQTFNAGGTTNSQSQTAPYNPTQAPLTSLINQITASGQLGPGYNMAGQLWTGETQNYDKARQNIAALPNFGPAMAQTASNIFQTGGDPTGILRREASNLNPIASMGGPTGAGLDPTQTPGMAKVLETIRNDVGNQINGQFAGAGRSLSGLNQQTLARGIGQGEAVPLLNQYNQNFANMLGSNQELGNVSRSAMSNLGQGAQFAQQAPSMAALNPLMQNQITQQQRLQPANYIGAYENLLNPIAGLGGTVTGSQQSNQSGSGTATNSILGQLGQAAGLINPFGGLIGTLFG